MPVRTYRGGVAAAGAEARMASRTGVGTDEELAALQRVATLVARQRSPEEVFASVTAEVGRLLGVDLTNLIRYDAGGAVTVIAGWASTSVPGPVSVDIRPKLGKHSVSGRVLETGRPARIDDYAAESGPAADLARELGVRGMVGAPIIVERRVWGLMAVVTRREDRLPPDTEARLARFTELVATAIANAQAHVQLRVFAEEQAALRRVATLVAGGAPPQEVFAAVASEVGRLVDADSAGMGRYDSDGTTTIVGSWNRQGTPKPHMPVGTRWTHGGQNLHTLVFQTGRPARIDDYDTTASGPGADAWRSYGTRAAVGLPIRVQGRLWGYLGIARRLAASLAADAEARLAGFTELVATALANAQARTELCGFADEQAALRRVATLVAQAAPPEAVFAAVVAEVGRLLTVDYAVLTRYDPDGLATVVGHWVLTDLQRSLAVGLRIELEGGNIATQVAETGRSARIDDYTTASGAFADIARDWGFRAAVGVPIRVEGRLWGVISAGSRSGPLPADTEARLAGFTELVATALANAEAQDQLTASRARIVATADTTRRRIERDLHDGVQQHLVAQALELRAAREAVPVGATDLATRLDRIALGMGGALDELREIARGIHPAALAQGGLGPALKTLARRSPVPVRLNARVDRRLPEPVELAAYYVVAEALTNTAKHAHASVVDVSAADGDGVLRIEVHDDGRGGGHAGGGSGLVGLTDRVEALGGRLTVHSPPGAGTTLRVTLPITATGPRQPQADTGRVSTLPTAPPSG
ncbi:MAG: histidine kinase [Frankiales bacterium]|nr:histidine kinase [Frankiales bacterium]